MSGCGICGLTGRHALACPFGPGTPVVVGGQAFCVRCRNTGFDRLDGILADREPSGPVVCVCPAGLAALRRLLDALLAAVGPFVVAVDAHPGAVVHLRDRLPEGADGLDAGWCAALADIEHRLLPALTAVVRAVDPLVERDVFAVVADPGDRLRRRLASIFDPLFPGRTAGGGRAPEEDDSG